MPKVRRERTLTKRHGSAVSFEPKSKDANEWKQAETKKTKGKKSQGADMIPVDDEDLVGLDVESGANESEESKRASIAEALKDLIAMGDDDDDDDDEEDDDDDDMSDYMKMMKPAKGTLFKSSKSSTDAASTKTLTIAATPSASAPALSFAPSAPSRSVTARPIETMTHVVPTASGETQVIVKKQTKLDKRAARHAKLMNRLGLPGTDFTGRGQKKHTGVFSNLKLEFSQALLTPSQQNARALEAKRAAEAKRDVLFLSDGHDRERMLQLQKNIEDTKAQLKKSMSANTSSSASAAGSVTPATQSHNSAPVAPAAAAPAPSPFVKTKPLTTAQRLALKRQELAQFTAVLHHPSFQAAPLEALQLHTANSVAMQKLEAEHASMMDGANPIQHAASVKKMTGSQKKKKKQVDLRRQQILAQANK